MLDIARKVFQRIPFSEYSKFTTSFRNQQPVSTEIVSQQIEQYGNFNRDLYRQHSDAQQQIYSRRLNRDFEQNTILRAEALRYPTYYGSSLLLFLLFDWQLYIGTSTYATMLLTLGGAAALFQRSWANTSVLPQITQIRLLQNNELDIAVNRSANLRVPLSNFKLNLKDENQGLGNSVEGFIANVNGKYYRINESARFNRPLWEKILQ